MSNPSPREADTRWSRGGFEQTQWTVILKAREAGSPGAAEALEEFARIYWPPLYRFIRGKGYSPHDAQDLTQGFYQHFLQKELLVRVRERQGKFRNFLLTCLKHFLSDEHGRSTALKRGGGRIIIALDALEAEERDAVEPADSLTADEIYERRWAQTIFTDAMNKLRAEYERRGEIALFDQLKELQPGKHGECSHAVIGARLGMSAQAVSNAALNFRRRYARCLRQEVARTVQEPGEVEEELGHLIRIFRG